MSMVKPEVRVSVARRVHAVTVAWAVTLAAAGAGCHPSRTVSTPAGPASGTVGTAAGPAAPSAEAAVPDSIRWVQRSAEYVAAFEEVYRLAAARIEAEARTHTAGSWAVVMDADETVINNAVYQEERARAGLGYSEASWDSWVKRREATPLPGAAAFMQRVHALGGRIAIVTNRLQSQCADTEAVFGRYSLVHDALLCRPDGSPSDKNPRFGDVAAGRTRAGSAPLDIVAFVGDNILDFPGLAQSARAGGPGAFSQFGVRFFLLPNPMYGSWQ
jgi:5'-nucleotidase (lipoprotein e(P4) family)